MSSFAPWCDCILCVRVIYEFMRAELISSKKMKLGWERVQVSRFWSAPEEVPSQPAAGTKSKVPGNSLYFFLPQDTFSGSMQQSLLPIPLVSAGFPTMFFHLWINDAMENLPGFWFSPVPSPLPYSVISPVILPDFVSYNPQTSNLSPLT